MENNSEGKPRQPDTEKDCWQKRFRFEGLIYCETCRPDLMDFISRELSAAEERVRAEEAAKYKKLVEATHELLYAVYTFFDPEAADEIWDKRVRKCAEDAKAILKALEGK